MTFFEWSMRNNKNVYCAFQGKFDTETQFQKGTMNI